MAGEIHHCGSLRERPLNAKAPRQREPRPDWAISGSRKPRSRSFAPRTMASFFPIPAALSR